MFLDLSAAWYLWLRCNEQTTLNTVGSQTHTIDEMRRSLLDRILTLKTGLHWSKIRSALIDKKSSNGDLGKAIKVGERPYLPA